MVHRDVPGNAETGIRIGSEEAPSAIARRLERLRFLARLELMLDQQNCETRRKVDRFIALGQTNDRPGRS